MKRKILLPIILGLLGFGLFFTSVAMAAPYQSSISTSNDVAPFKTIITPTTSVTPTTTTTHPVASALADYFDDFFDVDYSVIEGLHQDGYGFGVIAHAYFISQAISQTQGISGTTPIALLEEFASGKGWGVILKDYGLHPGLKGRGGNLGDIMSNRKKNGQDTDLGTAQGSPGKDKKNQPGASNTPPGQLRKSGGGGTDDQDQSPPNSPPGKGYGRGQGKKNP